MLKDFVDAAVQTGYIVAVIRNGQYSTLILRNGGEGQTISVNITEACATSLIAYIAECRRDTDKWLKDNEGSR